MSIPKGYKLVPVEPTVEMNKEGMRWLTGFQHMRANDKRNALSESFKAMVDASPTPPQALYNEAKGPVGCRYRKIDKRERAWTYREGVAKTPWEGWEVELLYTHADAGEVGSRSAASNWQDVLRLSGEVQSTNDKLYAAEKERDALQQRLTAADERADVLEGFLAGAYETAAKWVEKRMDDYVNEHGNEDPETGSLELPGTGDEYVGELMEIADGLRALKPVNGDCHHGYASILECPECGAPYQ